MSGQLDPFDDGLILKEAGQTTDDAIHSLWLAINSVLQLPRKYLTILDQWQAVIGTPEKLRQGATDRVKLAQGFALVNDGSLTRVDLILTKTGTPTGSTTVFVTIEADDGSGNPSGVAIATSTGQVVSGIGATDTALGFTFPAPAALMKATQYHLVLQGTYAASAANYVSWEGTNADRYPYGVAKKFDGTNWASAAPNDFYFKLFMQVQTA